MQKKKKKIMCCSVKFIEYLFSAVNIVYFKPSVGSLPRIKMSLFYYQYVPINSYQHQILQHIYKTHFHLILQNFHVFYIRYLRQNICIYQYKHS